MHHRTQALKTDRKILLIRFFKDAEETEYLQLEQVYSIDILARNVTDDENLYLTRKARPLNEEIRIDRKNDILLNLSSGQQDDIPNRLSNYKLFTYLSTENAIRFGDELQYFHSSIKFQSFQHGVYSFCIELHESKGRCVHQGTNSYLTFTVDNIQFSLFFVASVTAFALFLSALTSGLILGILSLDTHELQVLIK